VAGTGLSQRLGHIDLQRVIGRDPRCEQSVGNDQQNHAGADQAADAT